MENNVVNDGLCQEGVCKCESPDVKNRETTASAGTPSYSTTSGTNPKTMSVAEVYVRTVQDTCVSLPPEDYRYELLQAVRRFFTDPSAKNDVLKAYQAIVPYVKKHHVSATQLEDARDALKLPVTTVTTCTPSFKDVSMMTSYWASVWGACLGFMYTLATLRGIEEHLDIPVDQRIQFPLEPSANRGEVE